MANLKTKRNKLIIKVFSFVLIAVLLFTVIPTDFLISTKASSVQDTNYSITDINVDIRNNKVSAEISATENVFLHITVYEDDEDAVNVLGIGSTSINRTFESEFVDVVVSCNLPQYFVISAQLYNDRGVPLNDPFYFIEYTRAYEEYDNTKASQISPNRLVNLDESDDNNFMETAQGVIIINAGENGHNIFNYTYTGNTYKFSNIDSKVRSLNVGDKVVVTFDEGRDFALIDIARIEINGLNASIVSNEDIEMTDFFELIKISFTEEVDDAVPFVAADGSVNFDLANSSVSNIASIASYKSATTNLFKKEYKYQTVIRGNNNSNFEIDAGINFRIYITSDFKFSIKWKWKIIPKGISLYVKLGVGCEANMDVSAKYTNKPVDNKPMQINIYNSGRIPIGCGFNASFDVALIMEWKVSMVGGARAWAKAEAGIVFNSGSVNTYSTRDTGLEAGSLFEVCSLSFSIGPRITASIDWQGLIKGSVWVLPKIEVNGHEIKGYSKPHGNSYHMRCKDCSSDSCYFKLDAGFSLTYNIIVFKGTIVSKTYPGLVKLKLCS